MDPEKKIWSWQSSAQYHVEMLIRLPLLFIAPIILKPTQVASILSSVNEAVHCTNISSIFIGELQRLAGEPISNEVEIYAAYGRAFAIGDRKGEDVIEKFIQIVSEDTYRAARLAESVAYFGYGLCLSGNTIQSFVMRMVGGNQRDDSNVVFEIIFTFYYGSGFLGLIILVFLGSLYKGRALPIAMRVVTFIITIYFASWVVPYGIVSIFLLPFIKSNGSSTRALPAEYEPIDVVESNPNEFDRFTVNFHKKQTSDRIGLRFGTNAEGKLMITNVRPGSLLEGTAIQISDCVEEINGVVTIDFSPKMAAELLTRASGDISIVAYHYDIKFEEGSVGTV